MEGWAKEIAIGNNADLITNKVSNTSNYTNCYRWDDNNTSVNTTFVGGDASSGSNCGLVSLFCFRSAGHAGSTFSFAKCYILN